MNKQDLFSEGVFVQTLSLPLENDFNPVHSSNITLEFLGTFLIFWFVFEQRIS